VSNKRIVTLYVVLFFFKNTTHMQHDKFIVRFRDLKNVNKTQQQIVFKHKVSNKKRQNL